MNVYYRYQRWVGSEARFRPQNKVEAVTMAVLDMLRSCGKLPGTTELDVVSFADKLEEVIADAVFERQLMRSTADLSAWDTQATLRDRIPGTKSASLTTAKPATTIDLPDRDLVGVRLKAKSEYRTNAKATTAAVLDLLNFNDSEIPEIAEADTIRLANGLEDTIANVLSEWLWLHPTWYLEAHNPSARQLRPRFHLHTPKPREYRSRITRFVGRLISVQTYQIYQLRSNYGVDTVYWCPVCESGKLFARERRLHVRTLRSIIGQDTAPPVGPIDAFRERLR